MIISFGEFSFTDEIDIAFYYIFKFVLVLWMSLPQTK